jgi:hypothetical protein
MGQDKPLSTPPEAGKEPTSAARAVLRARATTKVHHWCAVCTSHEHPDGKAWRGAKRSNRREAILDAVGHNKTYTHHAQVLELQN